MTLRIETALTRMLDLDVPIVQAPTGGLTNPGLAAAVSNAGGLGMLGVSNLDGDGIRAEVEQTRRLTDRSFGINLVLDGADADQVEAVVAAGVRLVSFFWGDPGEFVEPIHRAGGLVAITVDSAAHARRMAELGVDVIVAQGWEAGGHVLGEVATLALVPAVVDAVPELPVVAAGGIADGRGVAAVLALGAAGAWLGTRFVLAEESLSHPFYREQLMAASETQTFHSTVFDIGWPNAPHRTLRNSTIETWLSAGRPSSGSRPGEGEVVARQADGTDIVRYSSNSPKVAMEGHLETLSMWAGQGVGTMHEVLPAGEIVRSVAAEAASILRDLPTHVHD